MSVVISTRYNMLYVLIEDHVTKRVNLTALKQTDNGTLEIAGKFGQVGEESFAVANATLPTATIEPAGLLTSQTLENLAQIVNIDAS